LKEIANRLRSVTRQQDTVARIGGDEFVMVLCEITSADDVLRPASTLLHAMDAPFSQNGISVNVSGSIGIAFYPDHAEETQALLARADEALYDAKHCGKNRYQFAGLPEPVERKADSGPHPRFH
jgi:two-component system cell cycle response regulator